MLLAIHADERPSSTQTLLTVDLDLLGLVFLDIEEFIDDILRRTASVEKK